MRLFIAIVLVVLACVGPLVHADTPLLRGRVVDPQGLPLPGATITVIPPAGEPVVVVTDGNGEYTMVDLKAGRYEVEAALPSFDTVTLSVDLTQGPAAVDLQLSLAALEQGVTVTAQVPFNVVGGTQADTPVSVSRDVMDIAMLPNSQIDDVLPLMPNVLRGPDGAIALGGARATSSALFVNGFDASDPIVGGAGIVMPLDAVESMQVYTGGAPAEFGAATGGVTAVQTRSGGERFHMSLDSFFPRLAYDKGSVSGVAFWDPNLGFGGAAGSRVRYQQALSYRYDRNAFTTLAGPDHNVFNALLSWTQVDVALTGAQRLRVFLSADPRSTDRANITAFAPGSAAPRIAQGGWTTGVSDAVTAHGLLIDFHASALHERAVVSPNGTGAYVLTHTLADGSYFDSQNRQATRLEGGVRLMWSPAAGHLITTGANVARPSLDQTVTSTPVVMLYSDGTVARSVTFAPASTVATVGSNVVGLFAQDRWTARPWLTLDAGLRYDTTTAAGSPPLSPRAGFTLGSGLTTLSGTAGLVSGSIPVAAQAFGTLPARTITVGTPSAPAATMVITNAVDPALSVPRAVRWDLELTRTLGAWTTRIRYDERHGSHELVVEPPSMPESGPGMGEEWLTSHGSSRSRSLEATAGVRTASGNEWYLSYVRAAASGASNSLDATDGLLRAPFIQPNLDGPLSIDVPHRILTWGVCHLPSHVTVAPFLDARSGFPFTAIDDAWVMVGTPGLYRLPWTASLDLSVTRITALPRHLPDARIGLKLYNIASLNTQRDVQRDIQRADFGTRYDPVPRDFSFVFEFLWGRHSH